MDDVHLNQVLKKITEEFDKLAKDNANLKHGMESMVMKMSKDIEERKNNEDNLSKSLK